ncbi:winged helix-turn-helix domain-containing protein [Streptomyces sp. MZ04]|uniref:winged helix-turn-helix domain-containing protein n=1 Tax=Streptomyces sp. MZ04 TaxID=2559236 RepID=UPI00107E939A|nr:winged helix-turn-helix domain-containing protein [Streptomyces sp. MZ04]TGA97449.1 GntR family transcriptional regulator [Streptomyces sp. MZ04]
MTIAPPTKTGPAEPAAAHRLLQTSDLPPYKVVANELRQRIRSGQLRPGDRIPSSRTLQDRFQIAGATALSAIRLLRQQGFVQTTHGRGSFVADPLPADTGSPDQAPPRMPTSEYTELSRRLDELAELQSSLLGLLEQADALRKSPASAP